jgi:hypothetical protein
MMDSSRSLNQPSLPRNQLRVWQGPGGMRPHEKIPMTSVIRPSIKKSHCQPDQPLMPLICRMPAARKEPTMLTVLRAVQNQASRIGSS